jgi:hypothetical protein
MLMQLILFWQLKPSVLTGETHFENLSNKSFQVSKKFYGWTSKDALLIPTITAETD